MSRHFHVAGARELLAEPPQPCPFLPGLTFDGLAHTSSGHHHLIFTLGGLDRFYVGPTQQDVTYRARILTEALHLGVAHLERGHADLIGWWVTTVWDMVLDELTETIARPDLDEL